MKPICYYFGTLKPIFFQEFFFRLIRWMQITIFKEKVNIKLLTILRDSYLRTKLIVKSFVKLTQVG